SHCVEYCVWSMTKSSLSTSVAPGAIRLRCALTLGWPARKLGRCTKGSRFALSSFPPGKSSGSHKAKVLYSDTSLKPSRTFSGVMRLRRPRVSSMPKSPQVDGVGRFRQRGLSLFPVLRVTLLSDMVTSNSNIHSKSKIEFAYTHNKL